MPGGPHAATWLAAASAAVLGLAVGWVLAPALGDWIAPEPLNTWDDAQLRRLVRPEPTELVRYGISVAAPLAAFGLILRASRAQLPGWAVRLAGPVAGLVIAAAAAAVAVGWFTRSAPEAATFGISAGYFSARDGAFALAFAAAATALALRGWAPGATLRSIGERVERRRALGPALAVAATVLLLVPGLYLGDAFAEANPFVSIHLPFTHADFAAVGNGRTPLADYTAQYSHLLPFLLAPALSLGDYSPATFSVAATLLSGAALLALFRVLALTTRSGVAALLLYLAVLAVSLLPWLEVGSERIFAANAYQVMPLRYVGPLVLTWAYARHLAGRRPERPWFLFLLAGLVAVNNPEFGLPALAALFVGLLAAGSPGPGSSGGGVRPSARALGGQAAAGAAAAVALVAGLTLLRSGELPDPGRLFFFSRVFGAQGFGMNPMPTLGFHLVVYVTFASALILAGHRAASEAKDGRLTGMLAFAGALGLGVGAYYAGNSTAANLFSLFPAWGLAVSLLGWAALRALRRMGTGYGWNPLVVVPAFLALFGLGLTATALLRAPAPWTQIERLAAAGPAAALPDPTDASLVGRYAGPLLAPEAGVTFIERRSSTGEPVAILAPASHYLARRSGTTSVLQFNDPFYVVSGEQLDDLLAALAEEGGERLFVADSAWSGLTSALRARGCEPTAYNRPSGLTEWKRCA